MKRFILSVLAVFTIAATVVGCGSSDTSSSGATELQGTWEGTWMETSSDATVTFTFSGNNWTLTFTSTSFQESGTFTINSVANPKTIDLYVATSTDPSYSGVGETGLGLYQLSGTNLTLALGRLGDTTRPTAFTEDNTINLVKQ